MGARIVIRGGLVPRVGDGTTVVIEGRRISHVAPPGTNVEAVPGDWDVDAAGRLVIPGLVDAHTHLALGALHRLAGLPGKPPRNVSELRADVRFPLERRATPERVEPLVRAAALASLRAGVTCVLDLVRGPDGGAGEVLDAEARALSDAGIRADVAYAARGAPGGRGGGVEDVGAAATFAARHASDSRLRGRIGLAGLADASEALLEAAAEPARRVGLHACVGEDEGDLAHTFARWGRRPVEVLAAHGLLGPRAVVAHAGNAVTSEGGVLAEAGAHLAIAPRAAMFWGSAVPPLLPFAAAGVPVVLGTDGMFPDVAGEALAVAMMQRFAERSAAAATGLVGALAWPAAARLASALFGERIGAIEPGALADLAILDWRPALPLPDAPDGDLALLWTGATAAWVIVDGEVRLREGRLLGGDERAIAEAARRAAASMLR